MRRFMGTLRRARDDGMIAPRTGRAAGCAIEPGTPAGDCPAPGSSRTSQVTCERAPVDRDAARVDRPMAGDRLWTVGAVGGLPPMLRLPEAARLLGIGRTSAYRLARQGQFPVPVVRIGKQYRVPAAGLLQLLGVIVPEPGRPSPETVDF